MILTRQLWEKKNIGVDSLEIKIELQDRIEDLFSQEKTWKDYDYLLARVPVGKMDIAYELQKKSFKFAEANIELSCRLDEVTLPKIFCRADIEIKTHEADTSERSLVYQEIKNGVFDTDKIALDPYFSLKDSGNRFYNWARTELNNNTSKMYMVECDKGLIGFSIIKDINKSTSYSLLAGVINKQNNHGLGYSVLYCPLVIAKGSGKKKMITAVSSNNPASLKMHLALGYSITSMNYVFIKHQ